MKSFLLFLSKIFPDVLFLIGLLLVGFAVYEYKGFAATLMYSGVAFIVLSILYALAKRQSK